MESPHFEPIEMQRRCEPSLEESRTEPGGFGCSIRIPVRAAVRQALQMGLQNECLTTEPQNDSQHPQGVVKAARARCLVPAHATELTGSERAGSGTISMVEIGNAVAHASALCRSLDARKPGPDPRTLRGEGHPTRALPARATQSPRRPSRLQPVCHTPHPKNGTNSYV